MRDCPMTTRRHVCGLLAAAWLLVCALPARADDPLRFVPAQAELVVGVPRPAAIYHAATKLDIVQQLQSLDAVRELYDTTNVRRLFQLIAYLEKQLHVPHPEMLDRLTGGGAVLAVNFSGGGAPNALGVIQAKDAKLLKEFVTIGLDILEQELARQEIKEKIEKKTYRDVPVLRVGPVRAAHIDAFLLLASGDDVMKAAIDTYKDGGDKSVTASPQLAAARKTMSQDALAWLWLNMESVRKIPVVKAALDAINLSPVNLVIQGGVADVVARTPYVAACLTQQQEQQFTLAFQMPVGRDGMKVAPLIAPPDERGTLPLLKPAGTLVSFSYFFDLGAFWEKREQILTKEGAKSIEDAEKQSALFLGGVKLGQLLKEAGPHQRLVVTGQTTKAYKIEPQTRIPAFAVVVSMREPAFGRHVETLLRAAAIFGAFQGNLTMSEEKIGDIKLVSYRFPEDKKFPGDGGNLRYNFTPCFAAVGDQFIVASTVELGRELIGMVKDEKREGHSPASTRFAAWSHGAAALLADQKEQLLTQFILGQALSPKAAEAQVQALLDLVDRAGAIEFEARYGARETRYETRFILGTKK